MTLKVYKKIERNTSYIYTHPLTYKIREHNMNHLNVHIIMCRRSGSKYSLECLDHYIEFQKHLLSLVWN